MHTLVRSLGRSRLLMRESATLAAALIVAETTYKFGSFALECLAMLGTWYMLSFASESIGRLITSPENRE